MELIPVILPYSRFLTPREFYLLVISLQEYLSEIFF